MPFFSEAERNSAELAHVTERDGVLQQIRTFNIRYSSECTLSPGLMAYFLLPMRDCKCIVGRCSCQFSCRGTSRRASAKFSRVGLSFFVPLSNSSEMSHTRNCLSTPLHFSVARQFAVQILPLPCTYTQRFPMKRDFHLQTFLGRCTSKSRTFPCCSGTLCAPCG